MSILIIVLKVIIALEVGALIVLLGNFRKVGGLYHFRYGRFGGSFYIARRR